MTECSISELSEYISFAYACHKAVVNEQKGSLDYVFLEVNAALEKIIGLGEKEILGKMLSDILTELSIGSLDWVDVYSKVTLTGKKQEFSLYVDSLRSCFKVTAFLTQRENYITIFQDITSEMTKIQALQQEKILYLSHYDHLTGLYNRRFMEEEFKRLNRADLFSLAAIMCDVNGLKLTNDVFGQEAGDKLLINVAQILKEKCLQRDIIARWGEDEFLILSPEATVDTAEKIIQGINNDCNLRSTGNMQISISFGFAIKTKENQNFQQIIKEAEESMCHQKLLEGKSYRSKIISTLLSTLAEKSIEMEEHAERLKDYCLEMAKELKLSVLEQDELALLAVLHDIGKIGVTENILQKPGPLTSQEWEEMKKHCEIGYRIAQNTPELAKVAEGILYHHERWDGFGYPKGLKGEKIPLLCRILAVADAYDAMTYDRVYRKGVSKEKALAEIRKNSGIQFDPVIVEIFMSILDKEAPV